MTPNEIAFWSLMIAGLSLLGGIAAMAYARKTLTVSQRQLHLQELTTATQGLLQKPALTAALISLKCQKDLMIAVKLQKDRIAEVNVPVVISNESLKTAEHVSVYVRMNKGLAYDNNIEVREPKRGEWLHVKDGKMGLIAEGEFTTFVLSIPRLSKHEHVVLDLPLSIKGPTQLVQTTEAVTKDNIPVKVTYLVEFAFQITVATACEGLEARSCTYSVEIFDTSKESITELLNSRNQQARQKLEKSRREMSKWSRFWRSAWLFSKGSNSDTRVFFIYEPSMKDMKRDGAYPVDRYGFENAVVSEGLVNKTNKTYWVPALGTTIFDSTAAPKFPQGSFIPD